MLDIKWAVNSKIRKKNQKKLSSSYVENGRKGTGTKMKYEKVIKNNFIDRLSAKYTNKQNRP
jgi:hypothetical protein